MLKWLQGKILSSKILQINKNRPLPIKSLSNITLFPPERTAIASKCPLTIWLWEMAGLQPYRTSIPAHSMLLISVYEIWPRPSSVIAIPAASPDHICFFLKETFELHDSTTNFWSIKFRCYNRGRLLGTLYFFLEYLKYAFVPQKLLIKARFCEYESSKSGKLCYSMLLMLSKITCTYLASRMQISKGNEAETSSTDFYFTQLIQGARHTTWSTVIIHILLVAPTEFRKRVWLIWACQIMNVKLIFKQWKVIQSMLK